MEAKIEHLKLIQEVIKRLAGNSFLLKGWSVTLISALFALSAKDKLFFFIVIAYFPAFMFWLLDGYFLRQERLFRKLYDFERSQQHTDFSMSTVQFDDVVDSWLKICFSKTLLIFHGVVVGVVIAVSLLIAKYA